MAKTINFRDRLYREVTAQDLGHRTLRSLKVGDYVWSTSTAAGKTDWHRVHKIGDLEPARYGRGTLRRVTLECVAYGWDPANPGRQKLTKRYETVIVFSSGDSVHIARPTMTGPAYSDLD